jgi:hypothetical protein
MLAMSTPQEAATVPITIRMDREKRDRLLAFSARYPFKLTLTQLIDAAVSEYLDRHEKERTPPQQQPPATRKR